MIKIPIENSPAQTFNVFVDSENKTIEFTIIYNSRGDYYTMSIKDLNNDLVTINNIKLVSGIGLLSAFNVLKGDFFVINSADYKDGPKLNSWNNNCELFYFNEEELRLL